MKELDRSKAPEGATHYRRGAQPYWRMLKDGEWHAWVSGEEEWIAISDPMPALYRLIDDGPTAEWNGEGLPPVGAAVEIRELGWNIRESAHEFIGKPVRVAAVFEMESGISMIAVDGGLDLGCEVFRTEMAFPIRTPEQIAAEERENAVQEMEQALADAQPRNRPLSALYVLYDAGYRKVTP